MSDEQQRRGGHVVVPGERADRHVGALVADVGELGDPAEVDQHGRRGEPQLHQRQQRLAAGQVLGVLAVLGRQGKGLVHGRGPGVGKRRGYHLDASSAAADRAAFTMLW